MAYVVASKVRENGSPVARRVVVFDYSTAAKIDETMSDGTTGDYSITTPTNDPVMVFCYPGAGFLPIARGPITPATV